MPGGNVQSRVFLFLLVCLLSLLSTGCAGSATHSADQDQSVSLVFSFKSSDLDPHNSFTPLRAGVTETLLRLDGDLNIQGWLASDWKTKDEKTWVFTIRDDVTFHDGTKVDAAAVKASFERGMADSEALAAALKIESMEAGGQTLTILTTEPHPSLPSELVNPYAAVVQVEAEKKMGKKAFNRAPVGTGPFQVKQFTPNTQVKLERFDNYWAGKPKLKEATITFNEDPNVRALALQSGEADIAYNLPAESIEAIEKDPSLTVESVAGLRAHFILYNFQRPLMQDRKIRAALDHLLNRDSVANDIMQGHGVPANGPFNNDLPFGSEEPVGKQDPDQAKALLKKAGYKKGADGKLAKDGKPLTLELITYGARPELPLMAQLLQSDAAKVGITIRMKTVEDVESYLKENDDWDLATYSNLTAPRGDGGYFLNTALTPDGSLNQGKINHSELNAIVHELNATSDIDKRAQLTRKAVTVIKREVLHSYGVHPNIIVGMNKRVVGWTPGGEEYYVLTHTMDVK